MILNMSRFFKLFTVFLVLLPFHFGTTASANESYASVGYFEDTFNSLTPNDLRNVEFSAAPPVINKSFGTHTHWIKLTLLEGAKEPLVLRVKPTYLDQIELYAEQNNHVRYIGARGDTKIGAIAQSNDLAYRFMLEDPLPGAVYYLKINTGSNALIAAEVITVSTADSKKTFDTVLIGGYIGISLVFSLISFVLVTRQASSLSWLLVAGIILGSASSLLRYGAIDFFTQQTYVTTSTLTIATTGATIFIFIQFLAEFIRIEQKNYWLYKFVSGAVLVALAIFCYQLIATGQLIGKHLFILALLNYALAVYVFVRTILRVESYLIRAAFSLLMLLAAYNIGINLEWISAGEIDLYTPLLRNLTFYFFLTYLLIKIFNDEEIKKRNLSVANETKAYVASQEKNRRFELEKIIGLLLHEIKTPLAIIQLAVDNLKSESEKLSPMSKKRLHRIAEATDQINAVIVKSAELERSNFQRELEVSKVSLSALIDKVLVPLDRSRVTVRCDENMHALTNEFTLEVILKNLVENAFKHSPSSSPITVSVALITSQLSQVLCLIVGNYGLPSQKELTLNKFKSSLETKSGKNIGLGLWLVTELCKTLNLEISSQVSDNFVQMKLLIPACPSNLN